MNLVLTGTIITLCIRILSFCERQAKPHRSDNDDDDDNDNSNDEEEERGGK